MTTSKCNSAARAVSRRSPLTDACAALLCLLTAASAIAQPVGKGLFIELGDGTELFDIASVAATSPGRPTGVQLHVCWSAIQNSASDIDHYDWTQLGIWLDAVQSYGLKAILRIDMIGGVTRGTDNPMEDPGLSTPIWFFHLPDVLHIGGQDLTGIVPSNGFPSGSSKPFIPYLPWYGDSVYQDRVAAFAQELRAFLTGEGPYDGEPHKIYTPLIECIRIGGWQANSNEPNFYFDYTNPKAGMDTDFVPWKRAVHAALRGDLQSRGVTYGLDGEPVLDDVGEYANAQKALVDAWVAAFAGSGIPLSTTVNLRLRDCTADNEFLMYSLTKGLTVLNPGLNEKDKTMTRTYFRYWRIYYGVKVGWGGITGIGPDDDDRIGAAFEGFGWNDETTVLPDCIASSTNPLWTQYRHYTPPIPAASYAIFGTNLLGPGQNFEFNCAREIIQTLAAP